ncbi:hypothetical protein ACP70R_018825 [Stipagrostis hirtigluma subsp. patula]
MALQNIGASNKDDAFYRYKMPRMITKTQGRGNGIHTVIENMAEIAKALARPASYTMNYFGSELGAIANFNKKTGAYSVSGAHDTVKLAGLLDIFIEKYVLCYGCGNPETKILISRTQMVSLKCAACGFVSDVDMRGKLTKFIIKNPPEQKKGGQDEKATRRAEKEPKKGAKKKGVATKEAIAKSVAPKKSSGSDEDHSTSSTRNQYDDNAGAADEDVNDDDVEWQTDTSLEAAERRMQEQLSAKTAELVMLSADDSDKKKLASHEDIVVHGSANPEDCSDDKQTIAEANPYNVLVEKIRAHLGTAATAAQLKDLLSASSTLPSQHVMNALFEALFDGVGKGFEEEVEKNKEYLAMAVPDKGSQALLLQAMETFCGNCSAEALKEVPFVLKALYYGDILEEETIVQWYNAAVACGKNSRALKSAKPFVEWLQSADSESEED